MGCILDLYRRYKSIKTERALVHLIVSCNKFQSQGRRGYLPNPPIYYCICSNNYFASSDAVITNFIFKFYELFDDHNVTLKVARIEEGKDGNKIIGPEYYFAFFDFGRVNIYHYKLNEEELCFRFNMNPNGVISI